MPMYLGSFTVRGMYLGSNVYDGFALGTNQDPEDYGIIQYRDPAIASDSASWTLNTGMSFASIGADSNGVRIQQGVNAGPLNAGLSRTIDVGRKYEIKVTLSLQSQPAVGQVWEGGVPDGGSVIALSAGDTYDYTFTATDTDFEIQIFNFNINQGRNIYIEEVYLREVS